MESIEIPIFYSESKGIRITDFENIREEFENKLREIPIQEEIKEEE